MVSPWVAKDFKYEFDFRENFLWASLKTRTRLLTGECFFIPAKSDKDGKRCTSLWFDHFCDLGFSEIIPALDIVLTKLDKDYFITRVLLDCENTGKLFIDLVVKEEKK